MPCRPDTADVAAVSLLPGRRGHRPNTWLQHDYDFYLYMYNYIYTHVHVLYMYRTAAPLYMYLLFLQPIRTTRTLYSQKKRGDGGITARSALLPPSSPSHHSMCVYVHVQCMYSTHKQVNKINACTGIHVARQSIEVCRQRLCCHGKPTCMSLLWRSATVPSQFIIHLAIFSDVFLILNLFAAL